MPSRSNGDGDAARWCGDEEQRVRGRPVKVGGGGVAVGRVEERVQEAARVLSYDQTTAAFFVWRKEKRS